MNASAGRRQRRTEVETFGRGRVEMKRGACEELAQDLCRAVDVAADGICVLPLKVCGRQHVPREHARESWARTARSDFRFAPSCRSLIRWAHGSRPRQCACPPSATVVLV